MIHISPTTAPSSASFMGVFGKRLFERSEFPIAAHEAEQHRNQAVWGALFFGYLLLSKQKKVTRLEVKRESGHFRLSRVGRICHLTCLYCDGKHD
jgi:hypothetical protein